MIDLNPNDLSWTYSTLKFICKEAHRYQKPPVVTFDQPLYWKTLCIVTNEKTESDLKQIVLRLGGFHTEMSFLGSIGRLMTGSGLHEVLETVYASNASGLSTDLTIEQILMRSVKSSGCLSRGRGMGESQRAQWILSMPACADYNSAIFKKANQSIILAAKPKSKSDSDFQNTDKDPQLMFQRWTTAANGLFENTSKVFQYELSSVPSSMFVCNRLPREACKSNLADAIWVCGSDCLHEIDGEGFQYVLDGGSLLQRLPWTHGDSFGGITKMYVDHVNRKYKDPDIVFDSYPELPSITDITHLRRTKGIISPNINFTSSMSCKTTKGTFHVKQS
ncbi:unnamed protein product [Mytilus coruscus]|uniref:Uncharacterized protein n=1 Tax=Mytilus coruscus TaxID=42192 RepID=A0A6J8F3I5_MYTCO|nr:unnamed protein product [Mytilus coruscus]